MAKNANAIIEADGTIRQQTGAIDSSNVRTGKGKYKVPFTPGFFKSTPYVSLTVMTTGGECGSSTNRTISISSVSANEVCVGIRRASGGDDRDDRPFTLSAFTPTG